MRGRRPKRRTTWRSSITNELPLTLDAVNPFFLQQLVLGYTADGAASAPGSDLSLGPSPTILRVVGSFGLWVPWGDPLVATSNLELWIDLAVGVVDMKPARAWLDAPAGAGTFLESPFADKEFSWMWTHRARFWSGSDWTSSSPVAVGIRSDCCGMKDLHFDIRTKRKMPADKMLVACGLLGTGGITEMRIDCEARVLIGL